MPPGLLLILLFFVGLFVPVLLMRWLQRRYLGSDDSTGGRIEDYGRGFGAAHWRRLNERSPGEAEKRKADFYAGKEPELRIRAAPPALHVTDTTRLQAGETGEAVSLHDLLSDDAKKLSKK